jgi:hypothetical protein
MKQIFIFLLLVQLTCPYSIFRLDEPDAPHFSVRQDDDVIEYELWDSHARIEHLRYVYNHDHFKKHLLPANQEITSRFGNKTINTIELDKKLNRLVQQVLSGMRVFDDFIVLKNKDFNRYQKTGLLVAELKDFPLVIKLFIETADGMVRPYGRGVEMASVFIAGGTWRHTLGFSRIQNIDNLKKYCADNPRWCEKVVFPRKWFWLPRKQRWLNFTIHNIGQEGIQKTRMPGIYVVVCDKLTKDPEKSPTNQECLEYCTHVQYRMDPHVRNFFIEKESGKFAIIDTEFFPWLLGYRHEIPPAANHVVWYARLAGKVACEKFLTSKRERKKRQYCTINEFHYKLFDHDYE